MHMADALLSPAVGGSMWAASAATIAYASRRVRRDFDDRRIPLMGVMGAFVFAAQMINFTIPGTGSSGHLGGALLLAILLGPHAALLTIASVLTVQALFFADGGLLALGSNIFNLGILPCYLAYPLFYRPLSGHGERLGRIALGAVTAAVVGLQLGAFGVVLETVFSGVSELPLTTFALLMQPIHLAIGLVEGGVTAAVVSFLWRAQPDILAATAAERPGGSVPLKKLLLTLLAGAVVTGGLLSWFASERPDGLEWSIANVTGSEELAAPEGDMHASLVEIQQQTALLPDYSFRENDSKAKIGTSLSGLVGGLATLTLTGVLTMLLRRRGRHRVS